MASFIHCADLHLGTEISSLGHISRNRAAEIQYTFNNIIRICKEEQVDYLLVAGDLFECAVPDRRLVKDVATAFAGVPDTRVIIAPGNHDYVTAGSCYLDDELWSDNVYIFRGKWDSFIFDDDRVQIFGAAFTGAYQNSPLMPQKIENMVDGYIHIGVLHGEIVAESGVSSYNPVTTKCIGESRLDYLALGHIHLRSEILVTGITNYGYSGCPEGRGFDEQGSKGIYMGEITSGICHMNYYEMSRRCYYEVEVGLDGVCSCGDIIQRIGEALKQFGEDYEENLYKIYLSGCVNEDIRIIPEDVEANLNVYYSKVVDDTTVDVDYEMLAKGKDLFGIFAKKMLTRIRECQEQGDNERAGIYQEALEMTYRLQSHIQRW